MIIAITSEGATPESQLDPRFGRAKYFLIYDDESEMWKAVDNKQNFQAAQGAGIQAAPAIANKKCNVLITGHCGPKAFRTLSAANIDIYLCKSGTVEESLEKFKKDELNKIENADVEGHWS